MRTDFAAGLITELGKTISDPIYLVELSFVAGFPVRLSSRELISFNSASWVAADMDVRLNENPQLSIFNENSDFGTIILTYGTAGKAVKIYTYYNTHGTLLFSGVMGEATIGERVTIQCKARPPIKAPRFYAVPPHCNFVPKTGTRIKVGNGSVIELEGR